MRDISNQSSPSSEVPLSELTADCERCFGLCCVALPFAASTDFAADKDAGHPCRNLSADFRCSIHEELREQGYRGCTVYDCFGAGQKVSQVTFVEREWRESPQLADRMFEVFPRMRHLHELLWYLNEATTLTTDLPLRESLREAYDETERLTHLPVEELLALDIDAHRSAVNRWLLQLSERVRAEAARSLPKRASSQKRRIGRGADLIGANLRGADLRAANLRGACLIAADLRDADLRAADLIGADCRDTDFRGADLSKTLFLTQPQINAAKGDERTSLPEMLQRPAHWLTER